MDENFQFHKKLKNLVLNELIDEESFKKMNNHFLLALKSKIVKKAIEQVLLDRKNDFFDFMKRYKRKNNTERCIDLNEEYIHSNLLYSLQYCPTQDLEKFKENNFQNEIFNEDDLKLLELIKKYELPVSIKKLLEKYKYQSLLELLEKGKNIEVKDFITLYLSVKKILSFRKRKINAMHAYKYAQSAPLGKNIEDFIFEVHELLTRKRNYRKDSTKIGLLINVLEPKLIQPFMNGFVDQIENEPKDLDIDSAEILAMKYYLLFETIHPFSDGNGRTGRALFTYLTRKFTQKNKKKIFNYPYIPIATNGSKSVVKGDEYSDLGSLSGEFSRATHSVLRNGKMMDLLDYYKSQLKVIRNNDAENFFNEIWNEIDKNHESDFQEIVNLRKEITNRDSSNTKDFQEILNSMEENTKNIKKENFIS